MLYIKLKAPPEIIYNVGAVFGNLTYGTIQPYIADMLNYKAFTRILGIPETEQQVKYIGCKTDFGTCMLSDTPTSIQVLILSKIAIAENKPICFVAGMIGDNYLAELMNICRNTDLVSVYHPKSLLPQIDCPERRVLEDNLIKSLGTQA